MYIIEVLSAEERSTPVSLICPTDRTPISRSGGGFRCGQCGRVYPIERGVVRFLERSDDFYEGAYLNRVNYVPKGESWLRAWPLWLINSGFLWQTRHHVPAGATVLELGCASGVAYFASRYTMIGLDLSFQSLAGVSDLYQLCLQADAAKRMPLPDNSVDAVVSSFFWEHIDPAIKPLILAECHRVLRPGGKLIFLYDVVSRNPLIASLRANDEERYQREFIARDGHVGYQTIAENRTVFQSAGFAMVEEIGVERTYLQSPAVYLKMREWGGRYARLGAWTSRLGERPWFQPYNALLRAFDESIGRIFPVDSARIALHVWARRA